MAARKPTWADVLAMDPPAPEQVELLGLSVIVHVLNQMTDAERARALRWLLDRYTPRISLGDEP